MESSRNYYSGLLQELDSHEVVVEDVKTRYYSKLEGRLAVKHGTAIAKFTIINLEMRQKIVKAGIKGDYYAVDQWYEFDAVFAALNQDRKTLQLVAA